MHTINEPEWDSFPHVLVLEIWQILFIWPWPLILNPWFTRNRETVLVAQSWKHRVCLELLVSPLVYEFLCIKWQIGHFMMRKVYLKVYSQQIKLFVELRPTSGKDKRRNKNWLQQHELSSILSIVAMQSNA